MIYILKTAINGTHFEVPDTITTLAGGLINIHQQIQTIFIPTSVKELDVNFFTDNNNIVNIEIDSNNPNYLSENGKIYSKDKTILYLYYLNETTVDLSTEDIKTIESFSFRLCTNLESIILPEVLEKINKYLG